MASNDTQEQEEQLRREREMLERMRQQEAAAAEAEEAANAAAARALEQAQQQQQQQQQISQRNNVPKKLSYRQASFYAAFALLFYAFRTRQQYYLAAVYLSSSKWAYVIFGNAFIAGLISGFDFVSAYFLQGLRLHEAEGLQDFFRWNVTETCLALTMFRAELQVSTAIEFCLLIWIKCLHQVAALREQHVRMTEDAVVPWRGIPVLRHVKLFFFLFLLQALDLWAAQRAVVDLLANGPSVQILFAFETAILLVSAWSHLLLWHLHVLDGCLHFGHEHTGSSIFRRLLHPWREYKATLVFAVELQAQAVQFVFYLSFFSFLLSFYGFPINLLRELYMSFASLKERLTAFFTYRRLMASMNNFEAATDEQLDEAGRVCIICRDEMTVHDCKCLPVCKHVFHKSCLREWLVQQQSCPTCRSDIASMQAQEAAAAAAGARREGGGEVAEEEENQEPRQVARETTQSPAVALATTATVTTAPVAPTAEMPQERPPAAAMTPLETANTKDGTKKPRRRKTVRFTESLALYKVTAPSGAHVAQHPQDGELVILRTITAGVLVMGQGRDGEWLQIPNGWIHHDTVECVYDEEK